MKGRLRAALAAIAWLVAVGAIALGAAGLVAATDPGTGTPEQARLEYAGDAEVAAALDRAEADLGSLSNTVDDLGTQARGALAAVIARDPKTMDDALAAGDKLLVDIVAQSGAIQAELAALPYVRTPEAPLHVSPAVRQRYQRLVDALAATTGLDSSWTRLTVDSAAASRLASQLADHDALVAKAASQGRDAKYAKAIATLKEASDTLAATKPYRDRLRNTVDESTLDQWIERNTAYDKALSGLYDALDKVGGKVTNKVRKAIATEKAARAQLPPDARGLVIIMGSIAEGGLNGAVVTIEEARAKLADALQPPDGPASSSAPSSTPGAASPPASAAP